MNMVKSLLLGTAAGFVALTGASAADLPGKAAAPAAYVKVCSTYGAGFYYIPGTDTCLQVGGFVRAQYSVGSRSWTPVATDNYTGYAMAYLTFDARTATEYGLLRSFAAVYGSGLSNKAGTVGIDYAFIQFGGLTAGIADSFYNFFGTSSIWSGFARTSWQQPLLLAYTADFGGGVAATLSLEDSSAVGRVGGASYGALLMPDIVASVRVTQGWGMAQIAGVAHQVTYPAASSTMGWGVMAGVKLNVGDAGAFWLQGNYAKGAIARVTNQDVSSFAADGYAGVGLTDAWSIQAAYKHVWSPVFYSMLYGSYVNINQPALNPDAKMWAVGLQNGWTPVKGFLLGLDVMYYNQDVAGTAKVDGFRGTVRVQRSF